MAARSPASSPRLPSPPPIAEVQIGPSSPGPAPVSTDDFGKLVVPQNVDHSAARRIRPGTKAEDMARGPPLVPLTEIDSPFQLTEHLKALHYSYTHPAESDNSQPIDKASAEKLAQSPEGVSRELWLYELCRFHTQNLNAIVIALFSAAPACSSQTCPDMRASEWQYLCAVHDPPKSCCAIDYCCHTLDWAGNILTSPKHFPSRLHLGSDTSTPDQQLRQLTNIFRRLYRIFAHAWFQHREVFWHVESQSGLYIFFKTVIDIYKLLPPDGYTIPEEAEGIEDTPIEVKTENIEILRDREEPEVSEEKAEVVTGDSSADTAPASDLNIKVEEVPEVEAEAEDKDEQPSTVHLIKADLEKLVEPEIKVEDVDEGDRKDEETEPADQKTAVPDSPEVKSDIPEAPKDDEEESEEPTPSAEVSTETEKEENKEQSESSTTESEGATMKEAQPDQKTE